MSRIPRYLRLLPAVVVLGTGLLVLKGVDIARAAQAAAAVDPDQPDNSGLAPTDTGAKTGPDYANDDGTLASPAQADVMSSLTRRRAELDARERALAMRENVLNAGEGRVDQKIAALKDLQTQIQGLLSQRDAKQDAQIASLVKTYSTMKAKDAARIFEQLGDDVLIPVAKGMKSDVLAPILAAMNPDSAQKLTVKLAALLKLPDAAPAAICPTPGPSADAAPPASGTTASATPAPLQTAALTPPPASAAPALPTPPAPPPPAPTPPPQAAAAPAPHKPAPRHVTPAKPAKPATASAAPPAKPTTASTTPPAKPTTASTTPPAAAPPVTKPTAAVTPPAATPAAATPAAATPPAKPPAQAASGPPASLTPPSGG